MRFLTTQVITRLADHLKESEVVEDFRFGGRIGRPTVMFLTERCEPTAYISNYKFWKSCYRKEPEKFFSYLVSTVSHESLHVSLFKISKVANRRIDRRKYFGDLTLQEFPIGLKLPI
jgi:hypothetical protein